MIGVQNLKRRSGIDPGAVLPTAVAAWRVADYSGAGSLLDITGRGHDAAMTDAPKHLPYTGQRHAWFPGTAGNTISTPKPAVATVEWVATFTDNTTASGTTVADPVVVGGTDLVDKKVKTIVLNDGIGGPVQATLDLTDVATVVAPFATITQAARVWTLNRSATGRKLSIVDRSLMVFGSPNRLTVPDHADLDFALTDPWTIAFAGRLYASQIANAGLIAKKAAVTVGNVGWSMYTGVGEPVTGRSSDGTVERVSSGGTFTVGTSRLITYVRDRAVPNFRIYNNGALSDTDADTIAATMANALDVVIGRVSAANADFEFFGAAIFRRALTVGELSQLAGELNAA